MRLWYALACVALIPSIGAAAPPPAPRDTTKGEVHHATASVEYALKDALPSAELRPGPFTVPKGYTAIKLKYRWTDPKTERESSVIQETTVYSVTRARYMRELKGNPDATLPAGEYKVVCGGMVGATGVLTYTLVRDDLVAKPDENPPARGERVIDVTSWTPASPETKVKAVYRVRDGKVTGAIDQVLDAPTFPSGDTCDPMPFKGAFVGTITGSVITGKWDTTVGPYKVHIKKPPYSITHSSRNVYETHLTLAADGTLTETMKGVVTMEWTYGVGAPMNLAGTSKRDRFDIEIPGKQSPEPNRGIWKERK